MFQSGRSIEQLERQFTVRWAKALVRAYATCFQDLKLLNSCPVPAYGGGILVCNHVSSLDPVLLQAACPRLITWMMAREYGFQFGLKWFFKCIEPILVERTGRDMTATREALRALSSGKLLGIFPEGRLATEGEMLPFQTGVALLASRSGVPVYPVRIDGTQRGKGMVEAYALPNHVAIKFGEPLFVGDFGQGREALEQATEAIRQRIIAMGPEVRSAVGMPPLGACPQP